MTSKTAIQDRVTVQSAVASIITENHPIYDCIRQKIINYHALAVKIKPEVEDLTGKKTSINSIVVAAKRFSDTVTNTNVEESLHILKNTRITLTSGIANVTINAKKSEFPIILERINDASSSLNEPSHIFQLSNSIKLIVNAEDYEMHLRSRLSKWHIDKEDMDSSKLSLHLAAGVEGTPGFASLITELLYRSGINIINTYIGEETILILNREDGPRAYDVLDREIIRSKKKLEKHTP
ncbi:MAG: hypothetical protein M1503_03010 [Thaumarchaeota archaeon]|nr:hypothetical protein [Nitrososphaerota archaeon]MCL5317222.1 hypothetical protein [Nitrososphaerota archaeon]